MLNEVLAVCVAGAVVVVIATILGAVELLRKPVAAITGRWSCVQAWLATEDEVPTTKTRELPPWAQIHSSKFSTENPRRPDLFTSLDVAGAQCDPRIALLKSKAMARAHACRPHEASQGTNSYISYI